MDYQGGIQADPSQYHPANLPKPQGTPPSYYPAPTTSTDTTNVVVVSQPQPVVTTHYRTYSSDYGAGALIFAVVATFGIFFFGCWWSLICSITAIVLAISAQSAGQSGNLEAAKQHQNVSIVCSVVSIVSTVIGFILFIIIVIAAQQ